MRQRQREYMKKVSEQRKIEMKQQLEAIEAREAS